MKFKLESVTLVLSLEEFMAKSSQVMMLPTISGLMKKISLHSQHISIIQVLALDQATIAMAD